MLMAARSYAEYVAMFDLEELPPSILDCSAGGSSFTAEANRRGVRTVEAVPAYSVPDGDLSIALRNAAQETRRINDDHADDFVWTWYGPPARRDLLRAEAAEDLLVDKVRHPERYVAAALPNLPFAPGHFDMVLCSHLLFARSDQYGLDWHVAAARELLRVCSGQVRIFPLLGRGTGRPVEFLAEFLYRLNVPWAIRDVPYELPRGANQMLVLKKLL
ncbi:hypothetical protein ABZX12_26295 [Kribbella sp. NPDC003505]|uniref:class I SAM-dependent methyltransferase n=1 Tax=Kribbella sp. NPDC003505 TaxID=3154448 RepID=UPI00339E634F